MPRLFHRNTHGWLDLHGLRPIGNQVLSLIDGWSRRQNGLRVPAVPQRAWNVSIGCRNRFAVVLCRALLALSHHDGHYMGANGNGLYSFKTPARTNKKPDPVSYDIILLFMTHRTTLLTEADSNRTAPRPATMTSIHTTQMQTLAHQTTISNPYNQTTLIVIVAALPAFLQIDFEHSCLVGEQIGRGGSCTVHNVEFVPGAPLPETVAENARKCHRMVIKIFNRTLVICCLFTRSCGTGKRERK